MGQTTVDKDEVFEPLPLDEMNWHWLDNGAPLFYGEYDEIQKHIEAHGFSIYYVVGMVSEQVKTNTNTLSTVKRNSVIKVVNTIVGRTVQETNELALDDIKTGAWFALPKIPYTLVKKLDSFFRYVDELHHTESIVLLTFDTTKDDSSGWGCLIPDQENTGGDCDYEPASVAGDKPDHVQIVGSAHSHPGMQAYASPTDHKDQATFDGLHITYGWLKSTGNKTEYHIELQMQGQSYQFSPDQIFGDVPVELPDDEVKDWAKKVKKKYASTSTSSGGGTGYKPNSFPSGGGHTSQNSFSGQQSGGWNGNKIKLPADAPEAATNTIVALLKTDTEVNCPFCNTRLIEPDYSKRRCLACRMYLALPGETVQDIVAHRDKNGFHSHEIDPSQQPFKPIHMWIRNGAENEFYEVYAPNAATVANLGK